MVLLKKIQIKDFLSHKDTELFFGDNQKLLIDGLSGSGKSSIAEAITWALYGEGRSDNRFLIRRGDKKAIVKLLLFDDTEKKYYHIIRSTTDKKHELEILHGTKEGDPFVPILVNGIRGLQDFIEKQILHCSYTLFLNSIYYAQDNPEGFAKQSAARRKDMLLEIIRAGDYDEYYEKTKNTISEYESSVETIDNGIRVHQFRLKILDETIKDLAFRSQEISLENKINETKKELEEITKKESNQTTLRNRISELRGSLSTLSSAIQFKQKELGGLQKEIKELESADLITLQLQHEEYKQVTNELVLLESLKTHYYKWVEDKSKLDQLLPIDEAIIQKEKIERDEAIKQIVELKKNNETRCVHCNKTCTRCEARLIQSTKYFEDQVKSKEYNISSYEKNLKEKDQALKVLGPPPEFSFEIYNQLVARRDKLFPQEQEYTKVSGDGAELRHKYESVDKINLELDELNSNKILYTNELESLSPQLVDYSVVKNALGIKLNDLETELFECKLKLTAAEKAVKEKEEINQVLEKELNKIVKIKLDIENLELLKDAFGNNGIKAIMVDYIIPRLEDRINVILSELGDFRVRLDTQKSGVGKDTILEGLFVSIINERGEMLGYESYSGGEKIKITMAISEALAGLQKTGFRILDEAINALDNESIERFVEMILKFQKKFPQLLIISHIPEVKNIFNERLNVIKINGISTLKI